jgi:ABC-type phosphate/phosphonate transport system substrate-binding protein
MCYWSVVKGRHPFFVREMNVIGKECPSVFRSRLSSSLDGGFGGNVFVTLIFVLASILLLCLGSSALAEPESDMPKVLKVGFSSKVFPDVDNNDARVAMELWAKEISRNAGIPATRVTIFRDPAEWLAEVRRGELHIITLSPMEYMHYRDKAKLIPSYIATNKTGANMDQLVIVNRKSGIQSVHELRGKSFAILSPLKYEAPNLWLDLLLKKQGSDRNTFFRQVKEFTKASQAIMATFFKQADGCLVSRGAYEICKTLNPQLGKELLIVAESKSLMGDITCVPANISDSLKAAMTRAALHLHENSVGKQILTLFQIDQVVMFKSSDLDGITELLATKTVKGR